MDPIKINVNVEVALSQPTLDILDKILGPRVTVTNSIPGFDVPPVQPEGEPQPKAKPDPQPEPAPAEPSAPVDDDDLPPDDTPTQKKATPSEDDARKAVKAARDRGVPAKTIKEFMKETFDIASSVECPAERRQELIDGLNKLAA